MERRGEECARGREDEITKGNTDRKTERRTREKRRGRGSKAMGYVKSKRREWGESGKRV